MNKSKIFGVFLILGSVMMLLSGLGVIADFSVFKLFGSIFLVYILIESIFKQKYSMIVFSIAFLAIMFAPELKIDSISPWPIFFAACMISIGMNIMGIKDKSSRSAMDFDFSNLNRNSHNRHSNSTGFNNDDPMNYNDSATNNDSYISEKVSFGESIRYITSQDFKRADIDASFSGVTLYFDKAVIKESAEINFNISFGGVEVYVPRDWEVVVKTSQFFAGVDGRNRYSTQKEGGPILYITGSIAFGGLDIHYV